MEFIKVHDGVGPELWSFGNDIMNKFQN
jgi:hypothetical protein